MRDNVLSGLVSDIFDRVTGLETIKTLAGAISLPSFTVGSLSERAGVAPSLVTTVLDRYREAFERLPSAPQGRRGRRPAIWRLKADRIDGVAAKVRSLQSELNPDWRYQDADHPVDPDLAEASLLMAMNSVSSASRADPDTAMTLLAAARDALVTAGFNEDGSSWGGNVSELAPAACLVAAVADVVDTCIDGDRTRIDSAQARAFPALINAKSLMSADQWLPLAAMVVAAPSTVLCIPVLAREHDTHLRSLFPTLSTEQEQSEPVPGFRFFRDTRFHADTRPGAAVFAEPTAAVVFPEPALDWVPSETKRLAEVGECLVVSSKTEMLPVALDLGAQFVLDRGPAETRDRIARAINSVAIGLDRRTSA